jgi:hypothetical protein
MRRARRLRVGVGLVAGWRHRGVDWLAVARAVARDLERATAKAAILEAYLNTVYFGQGAYGVQAPAKAFFSTSADRLTLPQAALLAGRIRTPVAYDPFPIPGRPGPPGPRPGAPRPPAPGHPGEGAAAAPLARRGSWAGWWTSCWTRPTTASTRSGPAGGPDGQGVHRGLRIATTVDLAAQAAAERAVASVAGRRGGDPGGALVAVEPGTGAVRSTVGGRSRDGPGRRRGGRRPGPARGGRPRR